MLVLARKVGESIQLTRDGVTINAKIVSIKGNTVRIGFDCPGVRILRSEIVSDTESWSGTPPPRFRNEPSGLDAVDEPETL